MQVIWKEELTINSEEQGLMLPKNATILTVQMQRKIPCIWFRVPELPVTEREMRTFRFHATGDVDFMEGVYLGTIQTNDESFVFHLYETTFIPIYMKH